ncbi:hypothetical protein B7494_g5962 [Chlorociboria aeruginascens]|nr:hypothetical protein B7494_g5962 [Chlorociboria aeruginascens]
MPALSPTMTEGNISTWKISEGTPFSAGDVLLEIETDKASMDVEAQDDGVLFKILKGDGSKGIQVGTRIGVLAEEGDDLSSLEIPEEDSSSSAPKKEAKSNEGTSKPQSVETPKKATPQPTAKSAEKVPKQNYPLLPSVASLITAHDLTSSIAEMTPTGPNNRLLKGDVLAYIGSIPSSYPSELSASISALSHLDLSNIKLASSAPASAPKPSPAPSAAESTPVTKKEIALRVSLSAVLEVQKKIQNTIGTFIPLSTFINRATMLANDDLPRPKNYVPKADELFNDVLGLNNVSSAGIRGSYLPQITAIASSPIASTSPRSPAKQEIDIIDLLTSPSSSKPKVSSTKTMKGKGMSTTTNVFSLQAAKEEEKQAKVFLERVKTVLEGEPGRLVL